MVNFFISVREAGRGKEEVVLPSHVCSKNLRERSWAIGLENLLLCTYSQG